MFEGWHAFYKVPPEVFRALQARPDTLCDLFLEYVAPPGVSLQDDSHRVGPETMQATVSYLEEEQGGAGWTRKAMGEGSPCMTLDGLHEIPVQHRGGDRLDVLVYCLDALSVSHIAAHLQEEWDPEPDYEENLGRFFQNAAAEGKAIFYSPVRTHRR